MPISRTHYTALVDDDGSGTVGTLWNKARVGDILDDIDAYVELTGTWTPNLTFGGAAVGMTYSTRIGRYTRSGNIVVAECQINLSAKGSSTGGAVISGLPVAANNLPTCVVDATSGMASLTGTMYGTLQTTTLSLFTYAATGRTTIFDTNFTNTSVLLFTLVYRV